MGQGERHGAEASGFEAVGRIMLPRWQRGAFGRCESCSLKALWVQGCEGCSLKGLSDGRRGVPLAGVEGDGGSANDERHCSNPCVKTNAG